MERLTLIELSNLLRNAILYDSQETINYYAKEIVDRIYIPFNKQKTYEEMLSELGYKEIVKVKVIK